ncbi:uncharacterized protein LOC126807688 [Patella vulgata]|uniref:uncharacterized protein LOC126807688 n=1 Tax=Patella vulgata TaxID=6465 RepID=UPI0024A98C87|nr:uncharacterized protein LOC126807688 [Patella vulgata]
MFSPVTNMEKDLYHTWIVKIRRSQSHTPNSKKLWEPSKHSHVCSKHFSSDSFTKDPLLLQAINFTAKGLRLKKDSFPTLSLGVEPLLGPDTPRGGFRKRERQRVLQDIFSNFDFEDGRKVRKANQDTGASYDLIPLLETSTSNNKSDIIDHQVPVPQSSSISISPDVVLQRSAKTYVKSTQTLRGVVSQGCQTSSSFIKYADAATQTDELPQNPVVVQEIVSQVSSSTASEDEYTTDDELNDKQDEDWFPYTTDDESDDSDSVFNEINITDILNTDKVEERKYIVFESNIKELLEVCRECHNKCVVVLKQNVGSMVVMEATCEAGHTFLWSSQPSNNQLPLGNLLLSASILFSGASVTNILNVLNRINVSSFTDRTYRHIQSCYLVPAVKNVWSLWQMAAVREVKGRNVKLGGDARCCSPGHTAKYGSYSLMDLESGIVLDVQLIQVTEVNNSYAMEKEGLIRGLEALKGKGVQATDLTTDRHCSVRKHMRTMEPDINHWFDVWHVAKGNK